MALAEKASGPIGNMGASVDDWDLVNLLFVMNSSRESEIIWLLSS